jgi:hypothetical protein
MRDAFGSTKVADTLQDTSAKRPRGSCGFEWRWITLVSLLLGISGGIRYWRDWEVQSRFKESKIAPFALSEFPSTLGDWRVVEGSETTLDPEIAQISGSSDHMIRTYVNEKSGETAVVMVLYGLAYLVWPHTPDACYPAAGFKPVPPARNVEVQTPRTMATAPFRMQTFVKFRGGQGNYQDVYYSFFNAGRWRFDMERNWKTFRYHPGMFKVQVQRQVAGGGSEDGSVKQLLGCIVQEIETRSTTGSEATPPSKGTEG